MASVKFKVALKFYYIFRQLEVHDCTLLIHSINWLKKTFEVIAFRWHKQTVVTSFTAIQPNQLTAEKWHLLIDQANLLCKRFPRLEKYFPKVLDPMKSWNETTPQSIFPLQPEKNWNQSCFHRECGKLKTTAKGSSSCAHLFHYSCATIWISFSGS